MIKILVYGLLFICLFMGVRASIVGLKNLPPYVGPLGRTWYISFRVICGAILLFLITPILVIIPLSFNAEPYFTYPMPGFSMRWYDDFFTGEQSAVWHLAVKNSIIVAIFATLLATSLGTVAAVGLSNSRLPFKTFLMGVLISPMIVPLVITAVGMYFFYSKLGITPRQLSQYWSGLHLLPVIALRRHYRDRDPGGLRSKSDPGFGEPWRRWPADFLQDNRSIGDAGHDLRRTVRVHYIFR